MANPFWGGVASLGGDTARMFGAATQQYMMDRRDAPYRTAYGELSGLISRAVSGTATDSDVARISELTNQLSQSQNPELRAGAQAGLAAQRDIRDYGLRKSADTRAESLFNLQKGKIERETALLPTPEKAKATAASDAAHKENMRRLEIELANNKINLTREQLHKVQNDIAKASRLPTKEEQINAAALKLAPVASKLVDTVDPDSPYYKRDAGTVARELAMSALGIKPSATSSADMFKPLPPPPPGTDSADEKKYSVTVPETVTADTIKAMPEDKRALGYLRAVQSGSIPLDISEDAFSPVIPEYDESIKIVESIASNMAKNGKKYLTSDEFSAVPDKDKALVYAMLFDLGAINMDDYDKFDALIPGYLSKSTATSSGSKDIENTVEKDRWNQIIRNIYRMPRDEAEKKINEYLSGPSKSAIPEERKKQLSDIMWNSIVSRLSSSESLSETSFGKEGEKKDQIREIRKYLSYKDIPDDARSKLTNVLGSLTGIDVISGEKLGKTPSISPKTISDIFMPMRSSWTSPKIEDQKINNAIADELSSIPIGYEVNAEDITRSVINKLGYDATIYGDKVKSLVVKAMNAMKFNPATK